MTKIERYKELPEYHILKHKNGYNSGREQALEWLLINHPHACFWEQKEIFSRDYRASNVETYVSSLEGALDSVRVSSGDVKVTCADLLLGYGDGNLDQACLGFVRKIRKVSRKLWNNFDDYAKTAVVAIAFLEYCLEHDFIERIEVRLEIRHVLTYLYEKAPGRGQYDDIRFHMRTEGRMYKKYWDSCLKETNDTDRSGVVTSYTYARSRAALYVGEESTDKMLTFVENLHYFCEPRSSKEIFQTLANVELSKDDVWQSSKQLLALVQELDEYRLTDLLRYIIWSLV